MSCICMLSVYGSMCNRYASTTDCYIQLLLSVHSASLLCQTQLQYTATQTALLSKATNQITAHFIHPTHRTQHGILSIGLHVLVPSPTPPCRRNNAKPYNLTHRARMHFKPCRAPTQPISLVALRPLQVPAQVPAAAVAVHGEEIASLMHRQKLHPAASPEAVLAVLAAIL
jgi:hypothetical protein